MRTSERNVKKTWGIINNLIRLDAKFKMLIALGLWLRVLLCLMIILSTLVLAQPLHSHQLTENVPISFYRSVNSFFFENVTPSDVKNIIMNIKNKPCPINCIPVSVIQHIFDFINPVLSKLMNVSVSDGSLPDSLKIVKVVPILKGGNSEDLSNHRPIPFLPVSSKIFGKEMYLRLYRYLNGRFLLSSHPYGLCSECYCRSM